MLLKQTMELEQQQEPVEQDLEITHVWKCPCGSTSLLVSNIGISCNDCNMLQEQLGVTGFHILH